MIRGDKKDEVIFYHPFILFFAHIGAGWRYDNSGCLYKIYQVRENFIFKKKSQILGKSQISSKKEEKLFVASKL